MRMKRFTAVFLSAALVLISCQSALAMEINLDEETLDIPTVITIENEVIPETEPAIESDPEMDIAEDIEEIIVPTFEEVSTESAIETSEELVISEAIPEPAPEAIENTSSTATTETVTEEAIIVPVTTPPIEDIISLGDIEVVSTNTAIELIATEAAVELTTTEAAIGVNPTEPAIIEEVSIEAISTEAAIVEIVLIENPIFSELLLSNMAYADENGNVAIDGEDNRIDFIFPSEINGEVVEKIGESAFQGCPYFNSVIIPESITEIGANAFADCEGLKYIIFEGRCNSEDIVLGDNYAGDAVVIFEYVESEVTEEPVINVITEDSSEAITDIVSEDNPVEVIEVGGNPTETEVGEIAEPSEQKAIPTVEPESGPVEDTEPTFEDLAIE